jgi:hypothetical protein
MKKHFSNKYFIFALVVVITNKKCHARASRSKRSIFCER